MVEVKNKIMYEDFWRDSSGSETTIIENAVSVLRNIYNSIKDLSSISSAWWQNSAELSDLNTATITITKDGFESYYILEVTTVNQSDGNCFFDLKLYTNGGSKVITIFSNKITAADWIAYGFRFMYLSTSKVFIFNISTFTSSEPRTSFSYQYAVFCKLKDGTSIYGRDNSSAKFWKDDGTYVAISTPSSNNYDVNKIALYNIYIGNSAIDGVYILRTSSYSSLTHGFYCELNGYGKYYALYFNSSSSISFGIKLDDEG